MPTLLWLSVRRLLGNIAEYVREGGAFVMIGATGLSIWVTMEILPLKRCFLNLGTEDVSLNLSYPS